MRIASAGSTWRPEDLTGAGAAKSPGRWNKVGEKVVYAAPTLAMAVLESAAHIESGGLPLNKYIIEITVPDDVWGARLLLGQADLPSGWDAIPTSMVSKDRGSEWYNGAAHALVELPSVIVPEESIVLINAQHPDSNKITAVAGRKYVYNELFRGRN